MSAAPPPDNLNYPVLLEVGSAGAGSAFLLHRGPAAFLVTASHVLFLKGAPLGPNVKATAYSGASEAIISFDLAGLQSAGLAKASSTHDVAVVALGRVAGGKLAPVSGCSISPGTAQLWGVQGLKPFSEVRAGNDIFVLGFPSALSLQSTQLDWKTPLLRKGIVAGTNKAKRTLVLDCPVHRGNSGGLVLEAAQVSLVEWRFSAIGVVTEFVPLVEVWRNTSSGVEHQDVENSGYSIAAPMDPVLELADSMLPLFQGAGPGAPSQIRRSDSSSRRQADGDET